jgi:hypothetical protein
MSETISNLGDFVDLYKKPQIEKDDLEYNFFLEKCLFNNYHDKDITLDNVYALQVEGTKLWNDTVQRVHELLVSREVPNVRYFSAKWVGLVGNRNESNSNKNRKTEELKREFNCCELILSQSNELELAKQEIEIEGNTLLYGYEMNTHLMSAFINLLSQNKIIENLNNMNYEDANTRRAVFAGGEIATALSAAKPLHELTGFDNLQLDLIAGPVVLRLKHNVEDDLIGNVNDFIYNTAKYRCDDDKRNTFSLYNNKLISLDVLFGGYFHFYVIGDAIFSEEPHRIYEPNQNRDAPRARFLFIDRELANRYRGFFDVYKSIFTNKVSLNRLYESINANNKADDTDINSNFITLPITKYHNIMNEKAFWDSVKLACAAKTRRSRMFLAKFTSKNRI